MRAVLISPIGPCRAELNYRAPIAKLEARCLVFIRFHLSVTARGQVWNTYLVTLVSYVSQIHLPSDAGLRRINTIMGKFMQVSRWLASDLIGSATFTIRVVRFPQPVIAECYAWWCGRQATAYGSELPNFLCSPQGSVMRNVVRRCSNLLLPLACWNSLARAGQDMINGVKAIDGRLLTRFVRRGMARACSPS